MFNHPSSRAGMVLAIGATVFSTSAVAAVTDPCQTPYTPITVDGSQGQQALQAAVQASNVELRLTGQFSITSPIQIDASCVRITSASAAAPATLTWTAALPSETQPARVFIHPHNAQPQQHHLEIRGLNFVNAGVHLLGSDHTVANNTFSQSQADVSVYIGSRITIQGNKFDKTLGLSLWSLDDALIDRNTFTNVRQPVGLSGRGNRNIISNNVATGTRYFGIELLGKWTDPSNDDPLTRFVGNIIRDNTFTLPAKAEPGDHGSYGGISLVSGSGNTIKGNTVDCGTACRVPDTLNNILRNLSYSQKGDLFGAGIEVTDAQSRVEGNTVKGFHLGIIAGDPKADVSALNDTAVLDGNKIYNTNHGIGITCYAGAANGIDPTRTQNGNSISECRRKYVITNNVVQNARDIGIGGVQDFYAPTKDIRYQMNMASESVGITIANNTVTRSYGAFPGDATVKFPYKRFVGITIGPIIQPHPQNPSPYPQSVTGNVIELRGTPPAGSEFGFTGIELMRYTVYGGNTPCDALNSGYNTLTGTVIQDNKIAHYNSAFGTGIVSTCGAFNGASIQNTTFTSLNVAQDLQ